MANYKYKKYGTRVNKNYRENNGEKASKKLDMRREDEFNYMLGTLLKELPDSVRGAVRGSIYAITSKKGIKDAKEYIIKKKEDGTIDEKMEKNLIDLIYSYSKYRN